MQLLSFLVFKSEIEKIILNFKNSNFSSNKRQSSAPGFEQHEEPGQK
jgi:hypothetical protein